MRSFRRAASLAVLAALVLAVPALSACRGDRPAGGTLTGGGWVLDSYATRGELTSVPPDVSSDIRFENARVTGHGGVNGFGGQYAANRATGRLTFTDFVTSEMAGPPDAMEVERVVYDALPKTVGYTSAGDTLTLYGDNGTVLLVYRAGAVVPDGVWFVSAFEGGAQALVSPSPGSRMSCVFANGSINGSGGVNNYQGTCSTSSNGRMVITIIGVTGKTGPPRLMAEEQRFLEALRVVRTWREVDGRLELRDEDGRLFVVLVRER
jgi:heat shock protein HslJ